MATRPDLVEGYSNLGLMLFRLDFLEVLPRTGEIGGGEVVMR